MLRCYNVNLDNFNCFYLYKSFIINTLCWFSNFLIFCNSAFSTICFLCTIMFELSSFVTSFLLIGRVATTFFFVNLFCANILSRINIYYYCCSYCAIRTRVRFTKTILRIIIDTSTRGDRYCDSFWIGYS